MENVKARYAIERIETHLGNVANAFIFPRQYYTACVVSFLTTPSTWAYIHVTGGGVFPRKVGMDYQEAYAIKETLEAGKYVTV